MKDHIEEKRWVHSGIYESVESWIDALQQASEGLINAIVDIDFGYDGPDDLYVVGWRPMTDKELAAAEKKRQKAKERRAKAAQTKIENEKKELARLKKKYEGES